MARIPRRHHITGTTVKDFMTETIVAVYPETSLGEVSELLIEHNVSGLPVVNSAGVLQGIVTEYDLVSKGSLLHIPTFMKLLKDFHLYRKDSTPIQDELRAILALKVKDVMNTNPLTLTSDTSIDKAVQIFSEHHRVNPILVVDVHNKVVGVLSRFDIMKLYTPASVVYSVFNRKDDSTAHHVDRFVRRFQKRFVLVKKSRTRLWFLVSVMFFLLGFVSALFFALRIQFQFPF